MSFLSVTVWRWTKKMLSSSLLNRKPNVKKVLKRYTSHKHRVERHTIFDDLKLVKNISTWYRKGSLYIEHLNIIWKISVKFQCCTFLRPLIKISRTVGIFNIIFVSDKGKRCFFVKKKSIGIMPVTKVLFLRRRNFCVLSLEFYYFLFYCLTLTCNLLLFN